MLMLDLCCGLKGASAAFRARGWDVLTLDIEPAFHPDIVADVLTWEPEPWLHPDFIWCSPPCVEFSRESMPWCKTGKEPDMSIVLACKRIIDECQPRYWCLENVRGAVRYFYPLLGPPAAIAGPFYLWGNFPPIGRPALNMRKKESYRPNQQAERAMIPLALSRALAVAIECQGVLFEEQELAL